MKQFDNIKKKFNGGGVVFFIIMLIVTSIFALALGGAVLVKQFIWQVLLAYATTVIGIFATRFFLSKPKKSGK